MATLTEPKAEKKTLVHYLVEGGVAIIELDDPPANTYTYDMMHQLDEAILRARFDDTAHVIVLRGHGEKFFSAGANIAYLNSITPRYKYFFCLHANETLNRLEHTPKLTIAALNGHTVGGGLEIAMACDLRLAKENAGKIGLPEVNLGVLPGTGGTQRLARIVGKARAIEMMVKGETFSFDKAKELGLVNEVFPADDYWEQIMLYAKQFTPPHKASKAVGLIKRAVQSGAEVPFESKIDVAMAIETVRYYAGWADKLTGDTLPVSGNFFTYTLREPVGVVGAIVPWNFPLNLATWKVAPALAAGCTVVLKPAHETPLTALLLGDIALAAGLPPGALNVVPGDPFDKNTRLGAIVSKRQQESVLSYIAAGSKDGARLVAGGKPAKVNGKGFYVEATVFDGAAPGMKIVDEEIFGPVLAVLTFESEAQGIELANRSRYGI